MTIDEAITYLTDYIDGGLRSSYTGGVVTPAIRIAIKALKEQSKIVQCKDCKHYDLSYSEMRQPWGICRQNYPLAYAKDADDYCKHGEMKNRKPKEET